MDVFEKFNSKFGGWYERLFGGSGELRPKDVLRKIMAAMEDNRKEGLDGKIYVPNKYVLELAVDDHEERDYLLSFLDEEELVGVLQRFMGQNKYHARGPLDFTIAEVPETERAARQDKLRVKARFEKGEIIAAPAGVKPPTPGPSPTSGRGGSEGIRKPLSLSEGGGVGVGATLDDLPTVPGVSFTEEELGTVPAIAWATLAVTSPEGRKSLFSLTRPVVTIGRSRNGGNDLILDSDGKASKSHARIERERDGKFTLYDLGSMNGVFVNNVRVQDNRALSEGDVILIGDTQLVFQQSGEIAPAPSAGAYPHRARLTTPDGESHILASETLIGRAVTADIVINAASVSTKHARIIAPDAQTYYVEDLDSEHGTKINGRLLAPRLRTLLADGDRITLGTAEAQFSSHLYTENGGPQ